MNRLKQIGIIVLALFIGVLGAQASALSAEEKQSLYGSSIYYDGTQAACSSSQSVTASTGDVSGPNVKTAYNFFIAQGYTTQQSAGILGNLYYESSGVNPTQEETDGGGGYGIAQFTGATLTALKTWAAAHNEDYQSLQGQLDYLAQTGAAATVKNTSTVKDATDAFLTIYERPKDPSQSESQRESDAQEIFNTYSTQAGSVTVTGTTTTGSSTGCGAIDTSTANCPTATGSALILCEAKKYNGIYYLYGGAHAGYAAFRQGCTDSVLSTAAAASSPGNPGPCATDCSGLVSMSVDGAFGQSYIWTVSEGNGQMVGAGANYWQAIPISQAQPGDILTLPGHVEIVDHITGGSITTFGSHQTGTKTGDVGSDPSYWTGGAYHWTGPGSS